MTDPSDGAFQQPFQTMAARGVSALDFLRFKLSIRRSKRRDASARRSPLYDLVGADFAVAEVDATLRAGSSGPQRERL